MCVELCSPNALHGPSPAGALSSRLPLGENSWAAALEKRMKPKILELNQRAFAAGRNLAVPVTG